MSDYLFILENHLDPAQNRVVAAMQKIATDAAITVWLTGGAMRDVLNGRRVMDLDFTVERDALKLAKQLAAALKGTVIEEDALRRGSELELAGGARASVFNARTERYSKPGAKPQIQPADIREDLLRRDFTINAIGLCLNRGSRGLLVDPTNGQGDLLSRELRSTSSGVFFDDPTRILRMVRFRHSLGFEVAPRLASQLENAQLEDFHKLIPAEAFAAELRALASSPGAVAALAEFEILGLLAKVSKALTGAKLNADGLSELEKISNSLPPSPTGAHAGGFLAFLTVLLQKLSPADRQTAIKNLKLSRQESDALKKLEAQAKKLESALKVSGAMRPSAVYEALIDATFDEVLVVLYKTDHRNVQERIHTYFEKYLPASLEVTDEQVAATGAKPGTPKFDKERRSLILTHLNSRPKKAPEPEPAPVPEPAAAKAAKR